MIKGIITNELSLPISLRLTGSVSDIALSANRRAQQMVRLGDGNLDHLCRRSKKFINDERRLPVRVVPMSTKLA